MTYEHSAFVDGVVFVSGNGLAPMLSPYLNQWWLANSQFEHQF